MALKKIYPNNTAELHYDTQTKEYVLYSKFNTQSGQYEKVTRTISPLEGVNDYLSKIELDAQTRLLNAFTEKELGLMGGDENE